MVIGWLCFGERICLGVFLSSELGPKEFLLSALCVGVASNGGAPDMGCEGPGGVRKGGFECIVPGVFLSIRTERVLMLSGRCVNVMNVRGLEDIRCQGDVW